MFRFRNSTAIACLTGPSPNISTFSISVQIDEEIIHSLLNFSYLPAPVIYSVDPEYVIIA